MYTLPYMIRNSYYNDHGNVTRNNGKTYVYDLPILAHKRNFCLYIIQVIYLFFLIGIKSRKYIRKTFKEDIEHFQAMIFQSLISRDKSPIIRKKFSISNSFANILNTSYKINGKWTQGRNFLRD